MKSLSFHTFSEGELTCPEINAKLAWVVTRLLKEDVAVTLLTGHWVSDKVDLRPPGHSSSGIGTQRFYFNCSQIFP